MRTGVKKIEDRGWEKGLSLIILCLFILVATGCGSSASGPTTESEWDRVDILKKVEDSGFFGIDITDDKSDDGALYKTAEDTSNQMLERGLLGPAEGTACLPVAWGRGSFERLRRDIDISITDSTAYVTVIDKVKGLLFVDSTDDMWINPWVKSFFDTLTRHAELIKGFDGWQLSKISPLDISLIDPAQQTVHIQWVRASANGEIAWEALSSSQLFEVPEGISTFSPGTVVLVEVKVTNTNITACAQDSFVFLHHPGGPPDKPRMMARDMMFDDGIYGGDKTAGDGIFSRTYTIGPVPGRYFATIDVIDVETFMGESTPYNSTAWGMPFIVVPNLSGNILNL